MLPLASARSLTGPDPSAIVCPSPFRHQYALRSVHARHHTTLAAAVAAFDSQAQPLAR